MISWHEFIEDLRGISFIGWIIIVLFLKYAIKKIIEEGKKIDEVERKFNEEEKE